MTYSLQLISRHTLEVLDSSRNIERSTAADQLSTSGDNAGTGGFAGREEVELGLGDGLCEILLGDRAVSNGLDSLDSLLGSGFDAGSGAADGDGEETSVRVGVVLGISLNTGGVGGSLGEEGEASGPLDVGLTTEESGKDGNLGLVVAEGGTGEGDNVGVLSGAGSALLTTEVLASGGVKLQLARAGGGNGLEEGIGPLVQVGLGSAISHQGNVGLVEDSLGVRGNAVLVQVRAQGGGGGREERFTKASVEGNRVSRVKGDVQGADAGLLHVENLLNLLVELVGYFSVSLVLFLDISCLTN